MRLLYSLIACLVVSSAHADAPDLVPSKPGHELFHQYYKYWFNQRGTHCCDETHCRPIELGELRYNGGWQIRLEGMWITLAATDAVVDDGGLGPFGSICHEGTHIFCVDLPDASM